MLAPHRLVSGLIAASLSGWLGVACADAGPPFLTDDPETPGPQRWEIILSGTIEDLDRQRTVEAPNVDLNYGIGERLQAKLETAWLIVHRDDGTSAGVGQVLAGLTWRFVDEDRAGVALSTYPQAGIAPWARFAPHHVRGDSGWFVPVEAERTAAGWVLVGEIGRTIAIGAADGWAGGLVVTHPLGPCDGGIEAHWLRDDGDRSQVVVDGGVHVPLGEHLEALASAGRRVSDAGPELIAFGGISFAFSGDGESSSAGRCRDSGERAAGEPAATPLSRERRAADADG